MDFKIKVKPVSKYGNHPTKLSLEIKLEQVSYHNLHLALFIKTGSHKCSQTLPQTWEFQLYVLILLHL